MPMSAHNGLVKASIFPSPRIRCTFSKIRSDSGFEELPQKSGTPRCFTSQICSSGPLPSPGAHFQTSNTALHLPSRSPSSFQLCIFVNQLSCIQALCVYLLIMYFCSNPKNQLIFALFYNVHTHCKLFFIVHIHRKTKFLRLQ